MTTAAPAPAAAASTQRRLSSAAIRELTMPAMLAVIWVMFALLAPQSQYEDLVREFRVALARTLN